MAHVSHGFIQIEYNTVYSVYIVESCTYKCLKVSEWMEYICELVSKSEYCADCLYNVCLDQANGYTMNVSWRAQNSYTKKPKQAIVSSLFGFTRVVRGCRVCFCLQNLV